MQTFQFLSQIRKIFKALFNRDISTTKRVIRLMKGYPSICLCWMRRIHLLLSYSFSDILTKRLINDIQWTMIWYIMFVKLSNSIQNTLVNLRKIPHTYFSKVYCTMSHCFSSWVFYIEGQVTPECQSRPSQKIKKSPSLSINDMTRQTDQQTDGRHASWCSTTQIKISFTFYFQNALKTKCYKLRFVHM